MTSLKDLREVVDLGIVVDTHVPTHSVYRLLESGGADCSTQHRSVARVGTAGANGGCRRGARGGRGAVVHARPLYRLQGRTKTSHGWTRAPGGWRLRF